VVLEDPGAVVEMSVTELAEASGVSVGSVIGFCRDVGLRGYQDLRIGLARDLVQPVHAIHEDLHESDDDATVAAKILRSDVTALEDTLRVLDADSLSAAADAVVRAARVEVYGIGSSMPVAIDAQYRLLRIGVQCGVHTDSHVQAVSASLTGPTVTTITISHSGSTVETLAATRLAKAAGATTIVITNFGKSPIVEFADVTLFTAARETRFRTEAMASRIAELSIVDALTACVALRSYERSVRTLTKSADVLSVKRY
jgi:RpiR family transcriptional regulator, carbohydrate utilization regulator